MNLLASEPAPRLTRVHWLLLFGCVLLLLLLRLRWVGHLLVWDEAMTLCTVRSFKAGANDAFSIWFWRHPPLYSVLMFLLCPFQSGFAERTELLSVSFAVVNQLLLFFLNRRVFGTVVALWSTFLLALIPGSVFFDVWIKQDHPATTFGLLAMLLLFSRRTLYAGLCLGLALLAKETAVFYLAAVFLLWLGGVCGKRTIKDFFALALVPALTCGWWYLAVLPKVERAGAGAASSQESFWQSLLHGGVISHLRFAVNKDAVWSNDWSYYFQKLPAELGWLVLALVIAGVLLALRNVLSPRATETAAPPIWLLWPVCLLVPALLLLSSLPNKVAWIVIILFPAWATMAAVGVAGLVSFIGDRFVQTQSWLAHATAAVAATAILSATNAGLLRCDYESLLREIDDGQARGASFSREAASKMNELTKDGDRALITSFYYWKGAVRSYADPIFTYYLTKKVDVLLRPNERPLPEVINDIREFRLDWALLSPEPARADEIFGGLERGFGLKPHKLGGAWLYRTAEIYRGATTNAAKAP